MKVGLIMVALALALLIAAVVVRVTVGSEFERVVAAEVATKSLGEAPRYSSGKAESATKKSSSQKESLHSSSGGSNRWDSVGPHLVDRWGNARRKPRNRRRYSSRKPNARTLSLQRLNRRASKLFLEHPMGRCPNHTNKSNRCLGLNEGAGPSPP